MDLVIDNEHVLPILESTDHQDNDMNGDVECV